MSTPTPTPTPTASDMFEQASRLKLRFDTSRGTLSSEDLWDLPLTSPFGNRTNLDSIAISLHRETREAAETVSFVEASTSAESARNAMLMLKFEIVKHIIRVRAAERDEKQAAADRREKKQRLLELIAKKENETLEGKSIDELRTLAESL